MGTRDAILDLLCDPTEYRIDGHIAATDRFFIRWDVESELSKMNRAPHAQLRTVLCKVSALFSAVHMILMSTSFSCKNTHNKTSEPLVEGNNN